MAQFKTRYVGEAYQPQVTSGDVIRQGFQAAGQSFQLAAQQKQKAIDDTIRQYGLDKPITSVVPSGLNGKFKLPAEAMLKQVQDLATKAKLSPTSENTSAYAFAKADYEEFIKIAEASSAMNNQTMTNVATGKMKDLAVTADEAKSLFQEFDAAPTVSIDGGRLTINGKYWREDPAFSDPQQAVFVPPLLAPEAKMAPGSYAESIASEIGSKAVELFGETKSFDGSVYVVGKNDAAIAEEVKKRIIAKDNSYELNNAISYNAYLSTLDSNQAFRQDMMDDALIMYSPSANDMTIDGNKVGAIKSIGADGNIEWVVGDDAIANMSEEAKQKVTAWRQAKQSYVSQLLSETKDRLAIPDDSAKLEARKRQKAEETAKEKEKEEKEFEKLIDKLPAVSYDQASGTSTLAANYSIGGAKIKSIQFDSSGEITSYQIEEEPNIVSTNQRPTIKTVSGSAMNNDIVVGLKNEQDVKMALRKISIVNKDTSMTPEQRASVLQNPGLSGGNSVDLQQDWSSVSTPN